MDEGGREDGLDTGCICCDVVRGTGFSDMRYFIICHGVTGLLVVGTSRPRAHWEGKGGYTSRRVLCSR
jgi:hypothetical protein